MNNGSTRLYNVLMGNPSESFGSIGRVPRAGQSGEDDFFKKRFKSLENAFGTTGSALISAIDTANENQNIENRLNKYKENMNDIYKKYGYNSSDEYYDAKDAAEKQIFGKYGFDSDAYWNKHAELWSPNNTDSKELRELDASRQNVINKMSKEDADKIRQFDSIQEELKGQSKSNAEDSKKASDAWRNYRENSYVGQKINQDRGKFAGSAINTLSTMSDVLLPTAGIAFNAAQGGLEGIADELEQNGLNNFNWERAGQNALTGAVSGGVVGGLNKGLSGALAKRGGNLFKGGNRLTQGLNELGSNTALGRAGATLATGAGRGALSGAVGGATGAGLSAAMNGQDVLGSAVQGAMQGAQQGAIAGGVMSGVNMAANKTPGVGNVMRQLNEAGENWQKSGNNFNERLTNTLTSGDSGIGNWLQGKPSKLLNTVGGVGNRIQDVSEGTPNKYVGVDTLGKRVEYTPDEMRRLIQEYDDITSPKELSGNSSSEVSDVVGRAGDELLKIYSTMNGGVEADPYNRQSWEQFDNWLANERLKLRGQENLNTNTSAKEYLEEGDTFTKNGEEFTVEKGHGANPEMLAGVSKDRKIVTALPNGQEYDELWERPFGDVTDTMRQWKMPDQVSEEVNRYINKIQSGDLQGANSYRQTAEGALRGWATGDSGVYGPAPAQYKGVADDLIARLDALYNDRFGRTAQTPDTLGGWLKKAGERIVEDANNRGVGMSIKDVGDDRIPLDESMQRIRNVKNDVSDSETIGKLPLDYMAGGTESPDINYISRIANEKIMAGNAKNLSIPELAYSTNNYNRAKIIEFDKNGTGRLNIVRPLTDGKTAVIALEKQPDGNTLITTIRPDADSNYIRNLTKNKGASVLYDTTDGAATASIAGAPAASRAIAGGNDSIIQQDDQNVNANMQIPQDIQNMRVENNTVESPETQVYRALSGETAPRDLTSVFNPREDNTIQGRNKLQSIGEQLQNAAKTQKYGALYDSLDAKTAARAVQTGAPEKLSQLGITPENYKEAAKTSNYINQVVSDLAEKSGVKINVPDLPSRLAADNLDVLMSDTATKKYNNYMKQIAPDGDTPDQYSAGYLLQKSRELGNKAANLRGNTDDVYALRQALTDAKYKLRNIATDALEGSEITGDLTNDNIAKGLAQMGANQKIQDYYTEAVNGKAPSVSDYIRRSALFEQARDMGTQMEAEKFTRSASKAPTNPMTKIWNATGLDQPVNALLRNTVAPIASGITNLAGKTLEGAGNIEQRIKGNLPASTDTTDTTPTYNPDYNPQTRLYNAIGRTEGLTNAEKARTANYLASAAQEAEIVPNNTLEGLTAQVPTTGATSMYQSAYGQTPQQGAASGNSFFPSTGDYWTDILGIALTSAINANDVKAFGSLYEMYQDATAKLQKQANSSNSSQKLTATQQRANAAMNSLDRLSGMNPDLGYNLSNIPVIGDIATLGGNDYESEARSLAQQIGYMVSGANIKEEEAANIGKAYVPQPWDSESTRRSKLQRAREIIQQYQNGMAEES